MPGSTRRRMPSPEALRRASRDPSTYERQAITADDYHNKEANVMTQPKPPQPDPNPPPPPEPDPKPDDQDDDDDEEQEEPTKP